MNLSKSKYCNGLQCHKMLWLEENKPELEVDNDNSSVLDTGTEVGILAKGLFGDYIDILFNSDLKVMVQDTLDAIETYDVCNITEASFIYSNNFCSVDILKKNGDTYEIYEVKSSTDIKDVYLEDASYQYYVLTSLGYNVSKVSIVYINSQYVRGSALKLDELFLIKDITSIAKDKVSQVEANIKSINEYMTQSSEPMDDIGLHCTSPYECPYFDYCTRHLERPNVFNIRGMRSSSQFKLYKQGIYKYEDLLKTKISPKYLEQIDFELNNRKDKINKNKIQEFLDTLAYPLYFLDFETFQQAIPMYEGIRPYEQIPFQYSLHYLDDSNTLHHKEFLSSPSVDPRRKLALQLVKDIPMNACTLAYNMSFEKTVIKHLADLYPDLREHLLNIRDNIKDLMIPFYNRDYYTKDMHGSYSIKYVLPALFPDDPSLNYHNLQGVHNGSEAMNAFRTMDALSKEEQLVLRDNLLKYCGLDTYAMVKIYWKLQEIMQNKVLSKKL